MYTFQYLFLFLHGLSPEVFKTRVSRWYWDFLDSGARASDVQLRAVRSCRRRFVRSERESGWCGVRTGVRCGGEWRENWSRWWFYHRLLGRRHHFRDRSLQYWWRLLNHRCWDCLCGDSIWVWLLGANTW